MEGDLLGHPRPGQHPERRPVAATSPVASTVNTTNVPRRLNTGRHGSNTAAHDPGKIITRT
jgi:hypothetical protein